MPVLEDLHGGYAGCAPPSASLKANVLPAQRNCHPGRRVQCEAHPKRPLQPFVPTAFAVRDNPPKRRRQTVRESEERGGRPYRWQKAALRQAARMPMEPYTRGVCRLPTAEAEAPIRAPFVVAEGYSHSS